MLDSTPTDGFDGLGLDPRLLASLINLNYTEPTPIQREAIPVLLTGRDLVGQAGTGTGKTAAFALPLLQRIAAIDGRDSVSALILVPTRELAIQVASAVGKYGRPLGLRVVPVYGGTGMDEQLRALRRGADVVVATPGRALDHIRRGTLDLGDVAIVVLDEADEMLDMGFADDLEAILKSTPETRQTMFFSATMPPRTAAVAARHLKDPVRVAVGAAPEVEGEAPKVRQTAYLVRRDQKVAALARVLDFEAPTSAIVFCRTRTDADDLAEAMLGGTRRTESLHGGLSQEQRDRVMRRFREGITTILVATDVAARGLDIGHLSHVVNFGMPESSDLYIHRTGRVGRAGREGVAITIADPREQNLLRAVERSTGKSIEFARVPTAVDLKAKRLEHTRELLMAAITSGGLEDAAAMIAPLIAEHGAAAVAVAAVAALSKPTADDGQDIFANQPAAMGVRQPRTFDRRPKANMARLFVGVGRLSGVSRRELIDAFGHRGGIDPRELGSIEITERFSLVEVPGEMADRVIRSLDGVKMNGRSVEVRHDRWGGGGPSA